MIGKTKKMEKKIKRKIRRKQKDQKKKKEEKKETPYTQGLDTIISVEFTKNFSGIKSICLRQGCCP